MDRTRTFRKFLSGAGKGHQTTSIVVMHDVMGRVAQVSTPARLLVAPVHVYLVVMQRFHGSLESTDVRINSFCLSLALKCLKM